MRRVAAFSLRHPLKSAEQGDSFMKSIDQAVVAWLKSKAPKFGGIDEPETLVRLDGGRDAILTVARVSAKSGRLAFYELNEPTRQSEFSTRLEIAHDGNEFLIFCTLAGGRPKTVIAPAEAFDVRIPRILSAILDLGDRWGVGPTAVTARPTRVNGRRGGAELATVIRDTTRTLPIIVVSEDQGFKITDNLDRDIARSVVGLANVVSVDDEASWGLTAELGQEYSVFNGAVRLYWPLQASSPFDYPLWTATKILAGMDSPDLASRRLCDTLRLRLVSVSTFAVVRPPLFDRVRADSRREEHERHRALATSKEDLDALLKEADEINKQLEVEIAKLREENARITTDLENQRLMASAVPAAAMLSPEVASPPATVAEALEKAKTRLSADLIFGQDVERGVNGLAEGAGPPEKILKGLEALADAAKARRGSGLGKDEFGWLLDKGVRATGEGLLSRAEKRKRTWHDGSGAREFENHIHVNENSPPDRCVRTYFAWDEGKSKYIVGWVGRHP